MYCYKMSKLQIFLTVMLIFLLTACGNTSLESDLKSIIVVGKNGPEYDVDIIDYVGLNVNVKELEGRDKLVLIKNKNNNIYNICTISTEDRKSNSFDFCYKPLSVIITKIFYEMDEDTNIQNFNKIAEYIKKYGSRCFENQEYAENYIRDITGVNGIIPQYVAQQAIEESFYDIFPSESIDTSNKTVVETSIIFEQSNANPMYYLIKYHKNDVWWVAYDKNGIIKANEKTIDDINKEITQLESAKEMCEYREMNDPDLYEEQIPFTIELKNGDIMKGVLYPKLAPKTVENFINLVNQGFYNGLIFHRVISGFMIQGGEYDESFYDGNYKQKIKDTITGEFAMNGFPNPLKHTRGVISMARGQKTHIADDSKYYDSATCQFFIVQQDSPHIDYECASFGKITQGLDVLDKIAQTKTYKNEWGWVDVPVNPIVIKRITIDR